MTVVPLCAAEGETPLMPGATVNVTPLLVAPATVMMTGPVEAPAGTGARILVALQLLGVVTTPLKATVLPPCVAPKVEPLIVTAEPIAPDDGFRLFIFGVTVKVTPLLA